MSNPKSDNIFAFYENIFRGDDNSYNSGDSVTSFFQNISIINSEFNQNQEDYNTNISLYEDKEHKSDILIRCLNCNSSVPAADMKLKFMGNGNISSVIYCDNCENFKKMSGDESAIFHLHNYFSEMKRYFKFVDNYEEEMRKYEEKMNTVIDNSFEILKTKYKEKFKLNLGMHVSMNSKLIQEEAKNLESLKVIHEITSENLKMLRDLIEKNKRTIEKMKEVYTSCNDMQGRNYMNLTRTIQSFMTDGNPKTFNNSSLAISNFHHSYKSQIKKTRHDTYASENNIICFGKKQNSYIQRVNTTINTTFNTNSIPIKTSNPGHQKTKSINIFHSQFAKRITEIKERSIGRRKPENGSSLESIKENMENVQLVNNI